MGMYTQLVMGVTLSKNTPEYVIDILKYMLDLDEMELKVELPDHPLFKTERWRAMLVSGSAYFDGHTDSSLIMNECYGEYSLNVRTNLKNYDSEIELFLHFIEPWLYSEGFLGYIHYEEDDCPKLIFHERVMGTSWIEMKKVDNPRTYEVLSETWLKNQASLNEITRRRRTVWIKGEW